MVTSREVESLKLNIPLLLLLTLCNIPSLVSTLICTGSLAEFYTGCPFICFSGWGLAQGDPNLGPLVATKFRQ